MDAFYGRFNEGAIRNFILCEELFFDGVVVVGLGALILNGLSYHQVEGNLSVLSSSREWDNVNSGIYEYEYIEGYDRQIGYEENQHIPTPERAICNCLLYSRWSNYLVEALQFYMEDEDLYNEEKLLKTAERLGISREIMLKEMEDVRRYYE